MKRPRFEEQRSGTEHDVCLIVALPMLLALLSGLQGSVNLQMLAGLHQKEYGIGLQRESTKTFHSHFIILSLQNNDN